MDVYRTLIMIIGLLFLLILVFEIMKKRREDAKNNAIIIDRIDSIKQIADNKNIQIESETLKEALDITIPIDLRIEKIMKKKREYFDNLDEFNEKIIEKEGDVLIKKDFETDYILKLLNGKIFLKPIKINKMLKVKCK